MKSLLAKYLFFPVNAFITNSYHIKQDLKKLNVRVKCGLNCHIIKYLNIYETDKSTNSR